MPEDANGLVHCDPTHHRVDDGEAKGRQVIGCARCDHVSTVDDRLVDPLRACVEQVVLDGHEARHAHALGHGRSGRITCRAKHPWPANNGMHIGGARGAAEQVQRCRGAEPRSRGAVPGRRGAEYRCREEVHTCRAACVGQRVARYGAACEGRVLGRSLTHGRWRRRASGRRPCLR